MFKSGTFASGYYAAGFFNNILGSGPVAAVLAKFEGLRQNVGRMMR